MTSASTGFASTPRKHVNPEFWQAFAPAMLSAARRVAFRTFISSARCSLEDVDPALLARATRVDKLPAVLDFAFRAAVIDARGRR